MDYLRGGTEFNLVLGIDFSISPRDGNLHAVENA